MVIVIKQNCELQQLDNIVQWIREQGAKVDITMGHHSTMLEVIGDVSKIDVELLRTLDAVESVERISAPYKYASRAFHPEDTVVDVGGRKFGGDNFQIIAGPCSIESEKQIIAIAKAVKKAGATLLRGGAYKPRTSPYTFQGLKESGLQLLLKAKQETGMPVVSEILSANHVDLFCDVDVIQIGARNMQNFELLKAVGKMNKPILLKRGFANTVEEWLMSAEYIMSEGAKDVILCERGIRTFEHSTRNTLDISAIPLLKEMTHLPVIVDPSHASGMAKLVKPLSLASVGAGADGLMIEVHNDPEHALSDGAQAIRPEQFADVVKQIDAMLPIVGKRRGLK